MGDGDRTTPGRPLRGDDGATGDTADGDWLTRSRRPKPGAAPWERAIDSPAPQESAPAAEPSGPVTVADLIAKINGGTPPPEPRRHRDEPEPESESEPEPDPDVDA